MEAFADVYERCFAMVYNYLFYRVPDRVQADELVSLVFERALERFERFDPARGRVEAWLLGIARNAVVDHFRARRWEALDELPERAGGDGRGDERLLRDESLRELARALAGLDERERELLALKFAAGMTNRAIAEETGLGESHVGVLVFRALRKLEAELS